LVESGRARLLKPKHLSAHAKVVLGLWSLGVRTAPEMADLLKMRINHQVLNKALMVKRDKFVRFARMVLLSKNPIVQECLRYGLPKACATPLPEGCRAHCDQCGADLSSVPCVKCGRVTYSIDGSLSDGIARDAKVIDSDEAVFVDAVEATTAKPGTPEKIAVMRARIERGEGPFHPDDPECRKRYVRWLDSMESL
jgi:hypothetical protein